jgi:hypothetical protein
MIDDLWRGEPPAQAVTSLQAYAAAHWADSARAAGAALR